MKIKIMTLNIWHGGRLWDNAVEFLKAENPDILLMQEVFNNHAPELEPRFRTMDEFKKIFDFTNRDFAPHCLFVHDFGKVEEGLAIFSKLPIIKRFEPIFFNETFDDNYVDDANGPPTAARNLQHVVVNADGTELDVLNFQGVWDLDGDNDSPKRQRMSKIIIDEVKGKPNVILGGDTNARPTNPAMQRISEELSDVFGTELKTTFNLSQKDLKKFPGYADSIVDMLFVSPGIKVTEHHCPEVDVSDHLPLVMTIELP